MRLFSRKPEPHAEQLPVYQPSMDDSALSDLSEMLWEGPEAASRDQHRETPGWDLLANGVWDYSVESVRQVEVYLDGMRARMPEGREWYSMTLRSAAYVGEVVRRNSKRDWHWLKYEEALRVLPRLAEANESGVASQWVLWDGSWSFAFPLRKVIKYSETGASESLHTFVVSALRDVG